MKMVLTLTLMHSSVGGDTLPAEADDVTKNAAMWSHYCLDTEKGNMLLSDVQAQPTKPTGQNKREHRRF